MIGLDQLATVYSEDPTSGAYTVVAQANLACRLYPLSALRDAAATGGARAELASMRSLMWDPAYVLPEIGVQVEINGERWNPVEGSFIAARTPLAVKFRRADVRRAQV